MGLFNIFGLWRNLKKQQYEMFSSRMGEYIRAVNEAAECYYESTPEQGRRHRDRARIEQFDRARNAVIDVILGFEREGLDVVPLWCQFYVEAVRDDVWVFEGFERLKPQIVSHFAELQRRDADLYELLRKSYCDAFSSRWGFEGVSGERMVPTRFPCYPGNVFPEIS